MSAPAAATPRWSRARAALPGLLLALALLLPFLGKAHTTDDVTFLLEARNALTDPLHPAAFDLVADGDRVRLSQAIVSGPLTAWLLIPAVKLGGAEWAVHLTQLLLMLCAVLATVSLAQALGASETAARFAGLLLAATPAVMVLATTAMADVPAMAFGVIGMERLVRWRVDGRWHKALAAVAALACATLARSQMLALLPLAAFAWPPAKGARATWWLAAIAAALFAGVTRATSDPMAPAGNFVQALVSRIDRSRIGANLAAFAAHGVLVIPLALPWLLARGRAMARSRVIGVAAVIFGVALFAPPHPPLPRALAPISLLGALVLVDVLADAIVRRDRVQLLLGLWLLIALPTALYVHTPAKFLVPSAPAVVILVARLLARADARLPAPLAWATLAVSAALGVAIALADAEFSDVGRRVARDVIAPRVRAGERVWYLGAWGAQWYAEQAGAVTMARQPPFPGRGDVLVVSKATPGGVLDVPGLDSLGVVRATSHFGRIMVSEENVGFWSNAWGVLPWTPRNAELDEVKVWRVPR